MARDFTNVGSTVAEDVCGDTDYDGTENPGKYKKPASDIRRWPGLVRDKWLVLNLHAIDQGRTGAAVGECDHDLAA